MSAFAALRWEPLDERFRLVQTLAEEERDAPGLHRLLRELLRSSWTGEAGWAGAREAPRAQPGPEGVRDRLRLDGKRERGRGGVRALGETGAAARLEARSRPAPEGS